MYFGGNQENLAGVKIDLPTCLACVALLNHPNMGPEAYSCQMKFVQTPSVWVNFRTSR